MNNLGTVELIWLGVGFAGQALFSMRFLAQWLTSEREHRSVVSVAFWWLSLAGGITLLSYALYRGDPVFIVGQGTGLFIYVRNLQLISRERQRLGTGDQAPRLADGDPGSGIQPDHPNIRSASATP